MTPAARVQAAIELLDLVIASAREAGPAADTIIARYFKARRYAGAKDRRAVRELVYRAIRRSGDPPASGRAAMIGLEEEEPGLLRLFDGSRHGPAPVAEDEKACAASPLPEWLRARLDPLISGEEVEALLGRAPLDVRVNRLKSGREAVTAQLPEAEACRLSPLCLRLPEGFAVEAHPLWQQGAIEVQDEGSQLVALACSATPGMLVVDLCAGAGGKALALAAEMEHQGHLIACDSDRARLSRLPPRLKRAGVTIVEPRLLDAGRELEALADIRGQADLVMVDAPCSGSGTWRRNPEARWRLNEARLAQLVALQARLLGIGADLLRPGGILVYAVCSMLAAEGREQAARLASARSALVPEPLPIAGGRAAGGGLLLTPWHDGTDGFFIARWRAPC